MNNLDRLKEKPQSLLTLDEKAKQRKIKQIEIKSKVNENKKLIQSQQIKQESSKIIEDSKEIYI